ncbi:hypothetical protein BZA70DRAFT_260783 [Myxozyma melibiosi]|uniref:DUF1014-domain-containing protein n=1 Tax=Myxozyma melibiosi TaxID=54550 RepID=A0ABR1EZC6_9ASCO
MAGKKTENSKKAAGQARKADAANAKAAAADAKAAAAEASEWDKGAKKGNAKKEADEAKKAEAARKKAEREALLKEEMESLPSKPKVSRGAEKLANKKSSKNQDFMSKKDSVTLNASNIDDALDALSISTGSGPVAAKGPNGGVERHPERRYKAALLAYEERRLPEVKEEFKGLRQNQMKDLIKKEFDKSELNPFNQVTVAHNATQDEVKALKGNLKEATEKRLAGN